MLTCIHVDDTSLVSPEESSYWNIGSISSTSQRCGLPQTGLIELEGRVEALIWFKGGRIQPCHLPSFFILGQYRRSGALSSYLRGRMYTNTIRYCGDSLVIFWLSDSVFPKA